MTDHPKTLILTTNRTEAGEPVYAPCGDLQELIAKWHARIVEMEHKTHREWAIERCAVELESALKPQGDLLVARPLQIGVVIGQYPKEEVKP